MGDLKITESDTAEFLTTDINADGVFEIGDTVTHLERQATEPIPGYKKAKQVVFSSIFPVRNPLPSGL